MVHDVSAWAVLPALRESFGKRLTDFCSAKSLRYWSYIKVRQRSKFGNLSNRGVIETREAAQSIIKICPMETGSEDLHPAKKKLGRCNIGTHAALECSVQIARCH